MIGDNEDNDQLVDVGFHRNRAFLPLKRLVFYSSKVLDFTIDTWNGRRSPRKHFDKETKNVK